MRKWYCVPMMTLCLLLFGCGAKQEQVGEQTARLEYQTMSGCAMEAEVTCGVGTEQVISFTLSCEYTPGGESIVEILSPETVAGIRAVVSGDTLSVVYEDLCLPAGTLSDEKLSPAVCLPWLMESLRDGWLLEENEETIGEVPCLRLCLDESSSETQMEAAVWLRQDDGTPLRGEIAVDGEIILTAEFTSFRFYDTIEDQTGEGPDGTGA